MFLLSNNDDSSKKSLESNHEETSIDDLHGAALHRRGRSPPPVRISGPLRKAILLGIAVDQHAHRTALLGVHDLQTSEALPCGECRRAQRGDATSLAITHGWLKLALGRRPVHQTPTRDAAPPVPLSWNRFLRGKGRGGIRMVGESGGVSRVDVVSSVGHWGQGQPSRPPGANLFLCCCFRPVLESLASTTQTWPASILDKTAEHNLGYRSSSLAAPTPAVSNAAASADIVPPHRRPYHRARQVRR